MKKRIISILLVVVMAVTFMSLAALAHCDTRCVVVFGTRGKPLNGKDLKQNLYSVEYADRSKWVGGNAPYVTIGKPVYMVQAYLVRDGLLKDVVDVDGICGPKTQEMIYKYQENHRLRSKDGVVGEETWYDMAYNRYKDGIEYLLPYNPTYS